MKTLRVILAASVLTAIAGTTFADEQVVRESAYAFPSFLNPVSVRAEVGTTGYGGAVSYRVNPYVGVTLGYNGGDISWSDDIKVNGSKYDIDMENNNTYLNAEIYPWGANQSAFARALYVAAGVAYLDNDYKLTRDVGATRSFRVNNQDFLAGANGVQIDGKMDYKNDIAPYLGFGLNAPVYNNFGVFGEVGAYYTGNPKVQLTSSGTAVTEGSQTLEQAVSAEEDKIANKGRYEWMPVAKVGVSFKF
ncbi:ornithine uptake porin CarO [Acinetobacter haemolyticus]|uniref:ornithine uptake porin CarO n=1 Tax=Acinetobacter haemolyticus TaxID=29430 RepID=UPI000D687B1A|nr:ornithine uptake porin CarO [Acinetobacter haemolyticus]